MTPLHLASKYGYVEIIKILSKHKDLDFNVMNFVWFNYFIVLFDYLIRYLINFIFYLTPIDIAANEEIKSLLIQLEQSQQK